MAEMTDTQRDLLDTLKTSYERYNNLVTRIIETVDRDYQSVYEYKRAILETISEALSNKS